MSGAPDLTEAEALAAEHALGVLGARERAEAELRMARDPVFAADVEAWRARFAPMVDGVASVEPPQDLWARIERSLPANDNGVLLKRVRFWRTSAMGGFGLAAAGIAAALVVLAQPPQVVTRIQTAPPSGALLNASLTSTSDGLRPLFVAAYDPARKALIITSLVPADAHPQKVQELWLIAGQENPKPVGFLEPGKAKLIPLPQDMAGRIAEGVTLAVSIEEPGGSTDPNGPQGPVVGAGALSKL